LEKAKEKGYKILGGTSIFDPLVCEIIYTWFAKKGFDVLDPFCGGSVRGIVAAKLGLKYDGIDLREEQILANKEQILEICPKSELNYYIGDSLQMNDFLPQKKYDLVFSCPPYADLEVYSDLPNDISNMNYDSFLSSYKEIIRLSCEKLKENRFAVFVVSDVRCKINGHYKPLTYDTIKAFSDCGLVLWNEIIMINEAASLPIRASRPMQTNRKVGRTHQKVLVFYKGDTSKIRDFGNVVFEDIFKDRSLF